MIEERDISVVMRDGTRLAVDVYRPDAPAKYPVLYASALHNKDIQGPDIADILPPQPAHAPLWFGPIEAGNTRRFIANGYVHVIAQPRGSAKSEGHYGHEDTDHYDLIDRAFSDRSGIGQTARDGADQVVCRDAHSAQGLVERRGGRRGSCDARRRDGALQRRRRSARLCEHGRRLQQGHRTADAGVRGEVEVDHAMLTCDVIDHVKDGWRSVGNYVNRRPNGEENEADGCPARAPAQESRTTTRD